MGTLPQFPILYSSLSEAYRRLLQPLAGGLHGGGSQRVQLRLRLREVEQVPGQGRQIIEVVGAAKHGFALLGYPIVHQAKYLRR